MIIDRLGEGHIIYTNCTNFQFCYHVGIVYDDGNKKLVYHNDPYIKNRYGGNVCAEKYENFMKNRNVLKTIRTHVTNDDIMRVARKCRNEKYDTFFFNCEDFVLEIVEGNRRSDIRDAYKIAALGLALIFLL
jgi:hypothetical protein